MKEFIAKMIKNLNENMDEITDTYGKTPKDYRNLGKEDLNNKKKDKEEQNER